MIPFWALLLAALGLIFLLWLNHKIITWLHRPKSETTEPALASSRPLTSTPPAAHPSIGDRVMSSVWGPAGPVEAGVGPVPHRVPEPVSVSAKPSTADTEPVPGATGANPHDTAARDIIRASLIAELLDAGVITNRDKAICQAFKCSKAASTRPDAPFQVALRLVEQHRAKQQPEYIGEMIERIKAEQTA
jgi:hypothetical protein